MRITNYRFNLRTDFTCNIYTGSLGVFSTLQCIRVNSLGVHSSTLHRPLCDIVLLLTECQIMRTEKPKSNSFIIRYCASFFIFLFFFFSARSVSPFKVDVLSSKNQILFSFGFQNYVNSTLSDQSLKPSFQKDTCLF